jgi:hypothetical protein
VRVLGARGVAARAVDLERFARGPAAGAPGDRPLEWVESAYDLARLEHELLEPHARGEAVELDEGERLGGDELLVLEGTFLAHPRAAAGLGGVVRLAIDEGLALRRIGARDAHLAGPESLVRVRRTLYPAWRALQEQAPAGERTLVLEAGNPLGPGPEARFVKPGP